MNWTTILKGPRMAKQKVWLKSFKLLGYRSCKRTQFQLQKDVTVMIGPNGVGKTNVLHGMHLLSAPDRRRRIFSQDTNTSRCRIEAVFALGKETVEYKARLTYRPNELNRDEITIAEEKWNFKELDGKNVWHDSEDFLIRRTSGGRITFTLSPYSVRHHDQLSRYWSLDRKAEKARLPSPQARAAFEAIQRFRNGITYYSASQFTNPALCPTSFEIDEDGDLRAEPASIQRRTSHTRFLYDLYNLSLNNKSLYAIFIGLVDARGVGVFAP